jgi:hypothetical protein
LRLENSDQLVGTLLRSLSEGGCAGLCGVREKHPIGIAGELETGEPGSEAYAFGKDEIMKLGPHAFRVEKGLEGTEALLRIFIRGSIELCEEILGSAD